MTKSVPIAANTASEGSATARYRVLPKVRAALSAAATIGAATTTKSRRDRLYRTIPPPMVNGMRNQFRY